MSKKGSAGGSKTPMTVTAASRIQSAQAKANGGGVEKGSLSSRVQSSAAKNATSKTSTKK